MTPDLFAKPEPPRRGSRLPADWKPSLEARAFAQQLGLDVDAVADQFRDYWIARAGAGGVKLDWLATWRNWCRSTAERKGAAQSPRRQFNQFSVSPAPIETEWWVRLRTYKPGKWWSPMWGPRPESGQCHAPRHEIARWKALVGLA